MGFSDRFRDLWNSDDYDDDDYDNEEDYIEEENDRDYGYSDRDSRSRRNRGRSGTSQNKRKSSERRRTRSREEELEDDFMNRYTSGSSSQRYDNERYYNETDSYNGYANNYNSSDYRTPDNGYTYEDNSAYHSSADSGYQHSQNSSSYQSSGTYDYSSSANNAYNDKTFFDINATTKLRVVCVKPQSYGNDIKYIADQLIDNNTILLNFEETPKNEIRSIIDFISGCAYVKHGKVQRIAKNIFIVTPNNVELKGDSLIGELANNGLLIIE